MSNLVINDLEMNQELDIHAATSITGGKGNVRTWLVKKAFKIGYAIGEELDKETGASDDLSDAAIDTFGPAPKWLQNWF